MKIRYYCLIALVAYITVVFTYAVLNRGQITAKQTVMLDLFWGYHKPTADTYRDNIRNIMAFIPVGALAALSFKKYSLLKAMLIGLTVSLFIECSQLIWKKGIFDVDDLFNNTVGAIIGGAIVVMVLRIRILKTRKNLI